MSEKEFEKEPNASDDTMTDEAITPSATRKKPKRISLTAFISSAIALVLATVMLTYVVCDGYYRKKLAENQLATSGIGTSVDESLALFAAIFDA